MQLFFSGRYTLFIILVPEILVEVHIYGILWKFRQDLLNFCLTAPEHITILNMEGCKIALILKM